MHAPHGDVHTDGLADGCPGCAEIAENPFANADSDILYKLVALAMDPQRLVKARSETEAIATSTILTALEHTGKMCEVAGDRVAYYLRARWNLTADIEPSPLIAEYLSGRH